jgi:hypothetical protein
MTPLTDNMPQSLVPTTTHTRDPSTLDNKSWELYAHELMQRAYKKQVMQSKEMQSLLQAKHNLEESQKPWSQGNYGEFDTTDVLPIKFTPTDLLRPVGGETDCWKEVFQLERNDAEPLTVIQFCCALINSIKATLGENCDKIPVFESDICYICMEDPCDCGDVTVTCTTTPFMDALNDFKIKITSNEYGLHLEHYRWKSAHSYDTSKYITVNQFLFCVFFVFDQQSLLTNAVHTNNLSDMLKRIQTSVIVGSNNESIINKLSKDLGVAENLVATSQLKNAIEAQINKMAIPAVISGDTRLITLPNNVSESMVQTLAAEYGLWKFVRGSAGAVPHPFHHSSRVAVTRYLVGIFDRNSLIYDLGGDFAEHLSSGNFNIHSVFKAQTAGDKARYDNLTYRARKWANKILENETSSANRKAAASAVLTHDQGYVCMNSCEHCMHIPTDDVKGAFAISVDTLFHITPRELAQFYVSHKIMKAVHAVTIPKDYGYRNSGLLSESEGHWYKDRGDLVLEFSNESMPYRQSLKTLDNYLHVPIIDIGQQLVFCKIGGFKGAHMLIDHFVLDRQYVDRAIVEHVIWFNSDMDHMYVLIPDINIDAPMTLLKKQPFKLIGCRLNMPFYERLLNRCMQDHTWASVLSYASAMIGRTFISTQGKVQMWQMTNTEVRHHCIVAYWSATRMTEALRPLVRRAETSTMEHDFLTQFWQSIKNWFKAIAQELDPTQIDVLQNFITHNKDDGMSVFNMFSQSTKYIGSLNMHSQMMNSRRLAQWNSILSGVTTKKSPPNVDNWRASEWTGPTTHVNQMIIEVKEIEGINKHTCKSQSGCPHNHNLPHAHIYADISVVPRAICECCGVDSNVNGVKLCSLCCEQQPCVDKQPRCPHTHSMRNDGCCSKPTCNCDHKDVCNCCGHKCSGTFCRVCNKPGVKRNFEDSSLNTVPNLQGFKFDEVDKIPDKKMKFNIPDPKPQSDNAVNIVIPGVKRAQSPPPKTSLFAKSESITEDKEDNVDCSVVVTDDSLSDITSVLNDPISSKPSRQPETRSTDYGIKAATSIPDLAAFFTDDKISNISDIDSQYSDDSVIDDADDNVHDANTTTVAPQNTTQIGPILPGQNDVIIMPNCGTELKPCSLPELSKWCLASLSVIVTDIVDVPGDGSCGAHAISAVTKVDVEHIKNWLQYATGTPDWHNDEELAAVANALNYNIIVVANDAVKLFRVNDNDDTAISIMHGSRVNQPAHWLACTVKVSAVLGYDEQAVYINYLKLIDSTTDNSNVLSELKANCYSDRYIGSPFILDTFGKPKVSVNKLEFANTKFDGNINFQHLANGLRYNNAPTGTGKTTNAILNIQGKKLLITPNRANVKGAVNFLRNRNISCIGRESGAWYPDVNISKKDIDNVEVLILTVDAVFMGLVIGKTYTYQNYINNRIVILDEVHQLTYQYMCVANIIGNRCYAIMSATLPNTNYDAAAKFPIWTNIVDDVALQEVITTTELNTKTMVVYATKSATLTRETDNNRSVCINSTNLHKLDYNDDRYIRCTECITTGVTLPHVTTVIDTGKRIRPFIIAQPEKMKNKKLRMFDYRQVPYTASEMMQTRGRVGRTGPGIFYGPVPVTTSIVPAQDEIMAAIYGNIPISQDALGVYSSIDNDTVDYVVDSMNKFKDDIEYRTECKNWLDIAQPIIKHKNAGKQLITTDSYTTNVDWYEIFTDMLKPSNKTQIGSNQVRVNIRVEEFIHDTCRSDWNNEVKQSGEYYTISINPDDIISWNTADVDLPINKTLLKLNYTKMVSAINTLIKHGKHAIAKRSHSINTTQCAIFTSAEQLTKYASLIPKRDDIVAFLNYNTNTVHISKFGTQQPQCDAIIVLNYRTGYLKDAQLNIMQTTVRLGELIETFKNSIWYRGPPGSGKTTAMRKVVGNGPILSKQTLMLNKFDNFITPNNLSSNYEIIGIDELGQFNAIDLLLAATHAKKLVCAGDLGQVTQADTMIASVMNVGVNLADYLMNMMTINDMNLSHRLGELSCSKLRNLGYRINGNNTKDLGYLPVISNSLTDPKLLKLIAEFSPQLILAVTNKSVTTLKQQFETNIPIVTIDRAIGFESGRVLVVVVGCNVKDIGVDKIYVALSRHTEQCMVVVDQSTKSLLTKLNVQATQTSSYADIVGGESYTIDANINCIYHNVLKTLKTNNVKMRLTDDVDQVRRIGMIMAGYIIQYGTNALDNLSEQAIVCLILSVQYKRSLKNRLFACIKNPTHIQSIVNEYNNTGSIGCHSIESYMLSSPTPVVYSSNYDIRPVWLQINGNLTRRENVTDLMDEITNEISWIVGMSSRSKISILCAFVKQIAKDITGTTCNWLGNLLISLPRIIKKNYERFVHVLMNTNSTLHKIMKHIARFSRTVYAFVKYQLFDQTIHNSNPTSSVFERDVINGNVRTHDNTGGSVVIEFMLWEICNDIRSFVINVANQIIRPQARTTVLNIIDGHYVGDMIKEKILGMLSSVTTTSRVDTSILFENDDFGGHTDIFRMSYDTITHWIIWLWTMIKKLFKCKTNPNNSNLDTEDCQSVKSEGGHEIIMQDNENQNDDGPTKPMTVIDPMPIEDSPQPVILHSHYGCYELRATKMAIGKLQLEIQTISDEGKFYHDAIRDAMATRAKVRIEMNKRENAIHYKRYAKRMQHLNGVISRHDNFVNKDLFDQEVKRATMGFYRAVVNMIEIGEFDEKLYLEKISRIPLPRSRKAKMTGIIDDHLSDEEEPPNPKHVVPPPFYDDQAPSYEYLVKINKPNARHEIAYKGMTLDVNDFTEGGEFLKTDFDLRDIPRDLIKKEVIKLTPTGFKYRIRHMYIEFAYLNSTHIAMLYKDQIIILHGLGGKYKIMVNINKINEYYQICGEFQQLLQSRGGANSSIFNLIKSAMMQVTKWVNRLVRLLLWKKRCLIDEANIKPLETDESVIQTYKIWANSLRFYNQKCAGKYWASASSSEAVIEISHSIDSESDILVHIKKNDKHVTIINIYCYNEYNTSVDGLINWYLCRTFRRVTSIGGSLDSLRKLGIDVNGIIKGINNLNIDPGKFRTLLEKNPLHALYNYSTECAYKCYKEVYDAQIAQRDTINNILLSYANDKVKIGFCIPSGHGKTTAVGKLIKKFPQYDFIDIDELVDQARILMIPKFHDKMQYYKLQLSNYLSSRDTTNARPIIIMCHHPDVLPDNFKKIIILNDGSKVPVDRIWSSQNVDSLMEYGLSGSISVNHVSNHDNLLTFIESVLVKRLDLSIVVDQYSELVDNIDGLGGLSFYNNSPHVESVLLHPTNNGVASIADMRQGMGVQRVYKTGPHVDRARYTIHKEANAEFNAVTSRLHGRENLRIKSFTNEEYLEKLARWFKPGWESQLETYTNDTIHATENSVIEWLIKKGSKLELITNMVENVVKFDGSINSKYGTAHYKVESLLKEEVNDILEQVGRIIVWHNQNINMFACPIVNECKYRLKLLLNEDLMTYSDGMAVDQLNARARTIKKSRYFIELDLSKQDRQTDQEIIEFNWWFAEKLGLPTGVTEHMTGFIPVFNLRTPTGTRTKIPVMQHSGGAMTSYGNEMRNLLLTSDVCYGHEIVHVFTLGDDSLILSNSKFDENKVDTICQHWHNCRCTIVLNDNYGIFLQMICVAGIDGGYYFSHNILRLREKMAYSPYPQWSSDWKIKLSSFLMMIGYSKLTLKTMLDLGIKTFPLLGTTMEERLTANAIYHGITIESVEAVIHDICTLQYTESDEMLIHCTMLMQGRSMLTGVKIAGDYIDKNLKILESLQM